MQALRGILLSWKTLFTLNAAAYISKKIHRLDCASVRLTVEMARTFGKILLASLILALSVSNLVRTTFSAASSFEQACWFYIMVCLGITKEGFVALKFLELLISWKAVGRHYRHLTQRKIFYLITQGSGENFVETKAPYQNNKSLWRKTATIHPQSGPQHEESHSHTSCKTPYAIYSFS